MGLWGRLARLVGGQVQAAVVELLGPSPAPLAHAYARRLVGD